MAYRATWVVLAVGVVLCLSASATIVHGDSAVGALNTVPPTLEAVNVLDTASIEVSFSKTMLAPGAATGENYLISGEGAGTFSAHPDLVSGVGPYTLVWSAGKMLDGALVTITASGVRDNLGNPIDTEQNSASDTGIAIPPAFTNLAVFPHQASEGMSVTITFTVSELLAEDPTVTVNGNVAARVIGAKGVDYTYEYVVQESDPLGPATIEVAGQDLAGNVGVLTDTLEMEIIEYAPVFLGLRAVFALTLLIGFVFVARHRRKGVVCLLVMALLFVAPTGFAEELIVSNVTFTQGPNETGGTKVNILYDLYAPNKYCHITVLLSKDGGVNFDYPVTTIAGDVTGVATGDGNLIVWDIAADYPDEDIPQAVIRVVAEGHVSAAQITLLGDNHVTVECSDPFNDPGATAVDDDGETSLNVTVSGDVDTDTAGIYIVTYEATSGWGKELQETRTVEVVDTTPPIIYLQNVMDRDEHERSGTINDMVLVDCLAVWDHVEDASATMIYDACSTNLDWYDVVVTVWPLDAATLEPASVPVDYTEFTWTPGYYLLDYYVEDEAGNSDEIQGARYVHVDDNCMVVTPDVTGTAQADAETVLINAHLLVDVVEDWNDEHLPGVVFGQNPEFPIEVAAFTTVVTIYVSKGPAVEVPDLIGMTEIEAKNALGAIDGLEVNPEISRQVGAPVGVYDQDPAPGTLVPFTPLSPYQVKVWVNLPDVVGMHENDAAAALVLAGYDVDSTYSWREDDVLKHYVFELSTIITGNTALLLVSWGKQPSAIFLWPDHPMTAECGHIWTDIDPLARVEAGDGTVMVAELATERLEQRVDATTWDEASQSSPLEVGEYRAYYRYEFDNLPGETPAILAIEALDVRQITVTDTTAPVVTVYGDDPDAWDPGLETYLYVVASGTYDTWLDLAAAKGAAPDGIVAEAEDDCEGVYDSITAPELFFIEVHKTETGAEEDVELVGTFALDETAPWLDQPLSLPGVYVIIYHGVDNSGNSGHERDAEGDVVYRLVSIN